MNKYELMIIVDPNISDDEKSTTLETIKSKFTEFWVNLVKEDIWWNKKMAYKIKWNETWYYVLYELEMEWTVIAQITRTLNLTHTLLRHMVVSLED